MMDLDKRVQVYGLKRDNRPRIRIFVSSAFGGETERNTALTIRYCKYAMKRGVVPFAPHLIYPLWLDDTDEDDRELGIEMGLNFLLVCHEQWAFFLNKEQAWTKGMLEERDLAVSLDMPVKMFFWNDGDVEGPFLYID